MDRIDIRQLDSQCSSELSARWDMAVRSQCDIINGVTPFSNPALDDLIQRLLAPSSHQKRFIATQKSNLKAVLPCLLHPPQGPLSGRTLAVSANCYPARAGLVMASNETDFDSDSAYALFADILQSHTLYDKFQANVTAGSRTESALLHALEKTNTTHAVTQEQSVAYIEFPDTWETLFQSLPKKFRYTIRSGESNLEKQGTLSLERFNASDECDQFLTDIEKIERASWKEAAGTSMTQNPTQLTFHRSLADIAAETADLFGYVLKLNDHPIAYVYSIRHGNVLLDLKESFSQEFAKFSPGTVLKAMIFQDVIEAGIKYWDFGGKAETHKLKWTDSTYSIRTYTCFSHSVRGRSLAAKHRITQLLQKYLRKS